MIFGIGAGKIEILLDSTNVVSGGKVSGKLKLELKSPKKAKELRVELVGEQWQTRASARKGTSRRKVVVYRFKQALGGEQEYTSGEYAFELQAPSKTDFEKSAEQGAAGALLGTAKMLGMMSPIEYYIVGTLDLPLSLNVSKKVQVAVV